MSERPPCPESTAHGPPDTLSEIRQSLDSLVNRLQRLEAAPGGLPSPPRVAPAGEWAEESTPGSRDALSVGQEILAIPSSGLEPTQIFSLAMDRVARLLSTDRA